MILANPLATLLPPLKAPPGQRPADADLARAWEALSSIYAYLLAVNSGRIEWHDETIYDTPTTIPHNLARLPIGRFIIMNNSTETIADDIDQWTSQKIVMHHASAGPVRIRFALI